MGIGGGGGIDAEMVPEGFFRIRDTSLLRRAVYVLAGLQFTFGGWYASAKIWKSTSGYVVYVTPVAPINIPPLHSTM